MTKRRIVIISAIVSVMIITVAGISATITLQPENTVTVSELTLSCITYPDRARGLYQHLCSAEGWVTDPHGNIFLTSSPCADHFPYGPESSSKYSGNAIPSEIVCPNAKKENINSESNCFETSGCTSQWFPDLEMVPTFIHCPADAGIIDNENVVFSNSTCRTSAMWRLP